MVYEKIDFLSLLLRALFLAHVPHPFYLLKTKNTTYTHKSCLLFTFLTLLQTLTMINIKTTILLIFIVFGHMVQAQNTFSVLFKNPLNEGVWSMIEDTNKDYIAVGQGNAWSYESMSGKVWKIGVNGDTLSRTYHFGDSAAGFQDIRQLNNGNYLVTGTIMWQPDYYENLLLLEINQDLGIVNKKIILLPGMEHTRGWVMKKLLNSYYIITATAGPNSMTSEIGDPYFIKLNANFDTVLSYHVKLPGDQVADDILFSSDSSQFFVFGQSYISLGGGGLQEKVVYDTSFNFIGYKVFPSDQYRGYNQAKWITDTTFIMGCNYLSYQDFNDYQCFMEMDTALQIHNENHIGVPDSNDYCGASNTFDFYTTDSIHFAGTKNVIIDFWPQDPSWIRTGILNRELQPYHERFYGGDAYYFTYGIICTSDGGSLICAQRYDYLTQYYEHDMFFLKLNNEGLITEIKDNEICPYRPFSLYPNPGSNILNISLVLPTATFSLSDMNGKIFIRKQIKSGENKIDCSRLQPGTYLIKIIDIKGESFTQKWIKQ